MTYDEFLHFLDKFEEISSFAGRIRAANENLTRLASGSGRVVYDIDGEKVLKAAKNPKGVAQNDEEANVSAYDYNHDVVTKVFDYDNQGGGNWIVSEKAKKVGEKRIKELTGIPSLYSLNLYLREFVDVNNSRKAYFGIEEKDREILDENEWVHELKRMVADHAQEVRDMGRPSTYGEVMRDGKPTIVLSDYGLSDEVYQTHYAPKRSGYNLYELVDMNRGEIYQDFTDGNEIRKAWWGFQPYNPPDGDPAFVNENFVKLVEARENFMMRRPIFNLMSLAEEFHGAMNGIQEYVNKADDQKKFFKNLVNLQEYLVEQGVYNRDQLLYEEDPPVVAWSLEKSEADDLAILVAQKVNLPTPSYIGEGGYGQAYRVGNQVLKITSDVSEADAGIKVKRHKPKTIVEIYNIWKIINNKTNKSYYVLLEEFIADKPVQKFSEYMDTFLQSMAKLSEKTGTDYSKLYYRMNKRDFDYDKYIKLINDVLFNENDLGYSDQQKQDSYKFMRGLGDIKQDLLDSDILKGSDYLTLNNLGYSNGVLKYFDVGGYRATEPILPEKNILRLNEEKYSQEMTNKITKKVGEKFNINKLEYMGSGLSGDAYDIGNDVVLKITSDRSEMIESLHLIGKKLKHVADIYTVYEVKSSEQTTSPIYVIMLEKLDTRNGEIKRKLKRLMYAFNKILDLYLWDIIDSIVFNQSDKYEGNKTQIENYFKKNPQDKEFFTDLVEMVEEIRDNNIESNDYRGDSNLGYKKDGSLGFFDIGFGDPYQTTHLNPKQLNVGEDGSAKFSSDNSIGRDDFPAYNNKDTSPSIENDLNANSAMYNETKVNEVHIGSFTTADFKDITNDEVVEQVNNLKKIDDRLKRKEYLTIDDANDMRIVKYFIENNSQKFHSYLGNEKLMYYVEMINGVLHKYKGLYEDLEYNHVDDATKDEFKLSEERTKAWMPGAQAVTVKKKCRLGGLGNTSVACNQGDIENLEFSPLKERVKSSMPKSQAVTVKKKCRLGGLGNTSVACNQGDINNLEFGSVNEVVAKTQEEVDSFISDSKVKETVYHGSPVGGLEDFKVKGGGDDGQIVTSSGLREDGMFFTSNPNVADIYRGKKLTPEFKSEIERQIRVMYNKQITVRNNRDYDAIENEIERLRNKLLGDIYRVKLKIKNPLVFDGKGRSNSFVGSGWDELQIDLGYKVARGKEVIRLIGEKSHVAKDYWKYDGIIGKNIIELDSYTNRPNDENSEYAGNVYVVFSPDQILIVNEVEVAAEMVNERDKSYGKGSKTVKVKRKCQLAGLGNTSVACNQGDINNLEFGSVSEEIDPSEAYRNEDGFQTILDGKRDVAFISMNDKWIKKAKDVGLGMIGPIKQNRYGYGLKMYILYIDKNKGQELYDIVVKNGGYLPTNTPEETRKIGELLGYYETSIDKFIERHFGIEKVVAEELTEAELISLQDLPFKNDVEALGGKIYSVGGAVRDEFLGKESKDLDILITGIPMEKLEAMMQPYGKVDAVGKSFGVLKFKPQGGEEIDVAVPRTETATGEGGHKGFDVTSDHTLPIEKDLERRDFTVNAIAKDIDGNLIDPFGGQQDLQNKIIRVVNPEAFSDDPLRMLRAVQFASRFGFTIEPKTMEMIKANAGRINEIPPERILTEFDKIVKKGNILTGAQLLQDTGLFKNIFGFDLNLSTIGQSLNNVNTMGEFIYLILYPIPDSAELYKDKLKGDLNTYKEINALEIGINNVSDDPIKNRSTAHNMYLISPKSLVSKILPQQLERAATELLIGKFPKSLKELAVNGNDLMQLGFKGKEIGDKLKSLLINVYAENVRNNKEDLLSLVSKHNPQNLSESKYSDTKKSLSMSKSISKDMKEKIEKYLGGGSSYHEGGRIHGLKKPKVKDKTFNGVGLGADKNGFYVYTHRARSKSKESPDKIPQKDIDFIESTG